jgi:hypothetical protein
MFYNQFNNSYDCNCKNDGNNFETHNKNKGYCTVKVIQECCYPSYWNNDKTPEKDQEKCCCKKEDERENRECKCNKEKEENYCQQRTNRCNLCSCFRRW